MKIALVFLIALGFFVSPRLALAQSQTIPLFATTEDYQRFLSGLPKAGTARNGTDVAEAHFNYGLGAQFNTPVSRSIILCDRETALHEMSTGINQVLSAHHFSLGTGWDPKYWLLKASLAGSHEIDPKAVSVHNVDLQIKLDQADLRERAVTFSYQVSACIRPNDECQDVSATDQVKHYMEGLLYEMRL